ncbi:MAG: UDP-N-acetylmuramate dehydrogenase [Candidatus Paceibacterota bacterium]|jgi:UDP-N-acetylmuramate dehydrogenase
MQSVKSLNIQKNVSLSKYTSFRIGGEAKFFCIAKTSEELREALEFADKNKIKHFILGGGSNLLVADKGFDGLVIKYGISGAKYLGDEIIEANAGTFLTSLITEAIKNNLKGLEWAAGIPGTVGGAICNNSGAYRSSMSENIIELNVLERNERSGSWIEKKMKKEDCVYEYRNSIFKQNKKYIILKAKFKLEKGNAEESKKLILEHIGDRAKKQPLSFPNAGCIFKNPVMDEKYMAKAFEEYPELKNISKGRCIPVWWFINTLKLSGKNIGGVEISEKHGNFLINTSNGKAEDVVILISLIKQKVRDNFGVQLHEEIEYVGF